MFRLSNTVFMIYRKLFLPLVALVLTLPVVAQQTSPTPPSEDQVVKISTNLIQIDVTVTDKNGKVVTGLKADDFEVFENGERQPISNFGFVSRTAGGAVAADPAKPAGNLAQTSPQQPRGSANNAIAIVLDDLNMSFASVYYARKALKKFVDEQMLPGDLVAIIRTGGGVGALQQFTSDKNVLYAAIDRIRWNPLGASGINALTSVGQNDTDVTDRWVHESTNIGSKTTTTILHRDNISDKKRTDMEANRNARDVEAGFKAQTSLGAVRYVISAMKALPGRKTMFLFTDGLQILSLSNHSSASGVYGTLREVIDVANRSSVVVYTFDTKGLQSMSIQASDNTYEIIDGHRQLKERERTQDFRNSQEGLSYFAEQTGGKALLNSNDLNGGIKRALDEQAGYYLLGYLPDTDTFDAAKRKYNKLEVKVRRPGLEVSYRSGFFNTAADSAEPQLSVQTQIANALMSPFAQNDISLNMSAMYANDPADGSYIRSFLHIDAKNLKFTDDAEGWKKATFDIAAITFGDNGVPVESKESKYTIKTRGATYETMLARGFVYVLIMPLKKSGTYQYRVAVRDSETGKIGSASQIVDVPDLGNKKLTLSNLAAENVSLTTWQNIAAGKVGNKPGQMQIASTLLYDTVLRQFKAGSVLRYGFEVYNAKGDTGSMPKLESQARIYQNNAVVVEGALNKIDASAQTDPQHVKVSGALMLKDTLQPGDYVLQLTVVDRSGRQQAMQLFPFEIVR